MLKSKQSVLLRVEALAGRQPSRQAGQRLAKALAFEGVSFSVAPGERVAIVGLPGAGKTALLRTVALLQRPTAGQIHFEDQAIGRLGGGALRRLRQRLQYVGGDPRYLLPPDGRVADTLLEPLQIHGLGTPEERRARCEAAASWLGVNRLLWERKASALSPALRQRVALARAFTLHPRIVLCDELIDRLEPAAARPLLEMVAHACGALPEPAAWVWTTSDRELAQAFSDRVLLMKAGRLEVGLV